MKSRIRIMAMLFFLILSLFLPLSPTKAVAETRVTITIAGGLACGLFFFIQYGFRSSLLHPNPDDATALLNRGPAGWEIAFPSIDVRPDDGGKRAYPDRPGETVQMELLKLRF